MSTSNVPQRVQKALWALAAGRCQICNCELIGDLLTGREDRMFGFVAHNVADSAGGTRGDAVDSPRLARELSNLLLLCARCHRLVDDEAPDDFPIARLTALKAAHEDRIRLLSSLTEDRESHVIRYGANIGANEALVSTRELRMAMVPERIPDPFGVTDLDLVGSQYRDDEPAYWIFQRDNLRRQFAQKVAGRIERQELRHASVFALAPQPLLIELGRLLGDILPVSVHQRHREPSTWRWQPDQPTIDFEIGEAGKAPKIALVIAISATVTDDRIRSVLGDDVAIWSIRARDPHNDVMRRPDDLQAFRRLLRTTFDRIKARSGESAVINLFPAMPVSAAVEAGRVWMPKADLPLVIFDQNRARDGFVRALEIAHGR
jgi:hypothetical protein